MSTWYSKLQLDTLLGLKAPLASPSFTGTPTVPTATAGTNTTQAASTAFVTTAVAGAGGGSGATKPAYRSVQVSSGDYTISATTPTLISSAVDLSIPAAAGDLVQVALNVQAATAAAAMDFNISIINGSGAQIRAYAAGTGTIGGFTLRANDYFGVNGTVAFVIAAGDIVSGNVKFRLLAKVGSGTRTLFANTATPLSWWAINFGPST